jgi:hypothetical protein
MANKVYQAVNNGSNAGEIVARLRRYFDGQQFTVLRQATWPESWTTRISPRDVWCNPAGHLNQFAIFVHAGSETIMCGPAFIAGRSGWTFVISEHLLEITHPHVDNRYLFGRATKDTWREATSAERLFGLGGH